MKELTCPCCQGTGKIEINETANPRLLEHTKLPKDYYCSKCKAMVTRNHVGTYSHTIFEMKKE